MYGYSVGAGNVRADCLALAAYGSVFSAKLNDFGHETILGALMRMTCP